MPQVQNVKPRIRIAVVDDHPIFMRGLLNCLQSVDDIEIVGTGASATEGLAIVERTKPDIILLDLSIPGGGLELARTIRQTSIETRCVLLTMSDADYDIAEACSAGVENYLLKDMSGPQLLRALRQIWRGHPFVAPSIASRWLACSFHRFSDARQLQ